MKEDTKVLKLLLCGPSDVEKEIQLAEDAIKEWNQINWEATDCGLQSRHWKTDSTPDLANRGQNIIDQQLVDNSDILIVVFWQRLGTPTGLSDSGTAEEIMRAYHRGIRTLVYFSKLEQVHISDESERERLDAFRAKVFDLGLGSTFSNRKEFRKLLRNHLGRTVHELLTQNKKVRGESSSKPKTASQSGSNNIQIVGDGNKIQTNSSKPPKFVIPQAPGQLTPSEQKQVSDWIEELATLSNNILGTEIRAAIIEWRSRFKNKFEVPRYNALESSRMLEAKAWFLKNRGVLNSKPRARKLGSADAQQKKKIKTLMRQMGRTNEDYYPEIAARLKLPIFTSLTKLSSKNLERVCGVVTRDSKK